MTTPPGTTPGWISDAARVGSAARVGAAVRVGDRRASLLDVVLTGVILGRWQEREAATAEGLAREAVADAPPDEVRQRVIRFRYDHRLISAADFRGWLAERALSVTDVERHVARAWLNEHTEPAATAVPMDLEALRVDAICSGLLAECAALAGRRLVASLGDSKPPRERDLPAPVASWLATTPLREQVDPIALRDSARRVVALEAAHTRLRGELATTAALAKSLVEHQEDWVRVRIDQLTFPGAGQAREAKLLLAEGVSSDSIERHALSRAEVEVFVEDADAGLQVELLRRRDVGDILVWQSPGAWRTATVSARTFPSLEDPVIVDRAERTLLDRELTKRGAGKVLVDAAL